MNLTQEELKNMSEDVKRLNPEICTETGLIAKSERLQGKKVVSNSQAKESPQKRQTTIKMPYIGNCLSVNHYKIKGRYTKPEVAEWMNDLVLLINNCRITDWQPPLRVTVSATYRDERSACDTHNLLKIIADCVQMATGLNDKYYETATTGPAFDKNQDPFLLIKIKELEEEEL